MQKTRRNRVLVFIAASLAACMFFNSPIKADILEPAQIRGLVHNGRVIEQNWQFVESMPVDTGFSVEPCFVFRDEGGRRFIVLVSGLNSARFTPFQVYRLEVRFLGWTPGGVPLARPAGRTIVFAQERPAYEGDIRESDPRLEEIKKALAAGQSAPASLRLRYAGPRGDFLAFYDLEGREILYQFRDDRFDDRGDAALQSLVAGQAYEVSGNFLGVFFKNHLARTGDADYSAALLVPDSTIVYRFQGVVPLRLEQILF